MNREVFESDSGAEAPATVLRTSPSGVQALVHGVILVAVTFRGDLQELKRAVGEVALQKHIVKWMRKQLADIWKQVHGLRLADGSLRITFCVQPPGRNEQGVDWSAIIKNAHIQLLDILKELIREELPHPIEEREPLRIQSVNTEISRDESVLNCRIDLNHWNEEAVGLHVADHFKNLLQTNITMFNNLRLVENSVRCLNTETEPQHFILDVVSAGSLPEGFINEHDQYEVSISNAAHHEQNLIGIARSAPAPLTVADEPMQLPRDSSSNSESD